MSPGDRRGRGGWDAFPEASAPLRVDGGLRARSTRGAIGQAWWSRRFLDVLEVLAVGGRLARGRSYARAGQVLSLEVAPGLVRARVQGSRPSPYEASVVLAPLGEETWACVEEALAASAGLSARLLAGEMPAELEDVVTACGADLFPRRPGALGMTCSCPDHEVPCKHLAAVLYLLAERFDEDPFEVLHWRGRPRPELLTRLRAHRAGRPATTGDDGPAPASPRRPDGPQAGAHSDQVGAAAALRDIPRPGEQWGERLTELNAVPALPPVPVHPLLPADLLVRQLGDPPSELGGSVLGAELAALYKELGRVEDQTS